MFWFLAYLLYFIRSIEIFYINWSVITRVTTSLFNALFLFSFIQITSLKIFIFCKDYSTIFSLTL